VKPSENNFYPIDELIELAIDGSISPEQSQQLNDAIVSHAAVRRHYCEYIQLNLNIERLICTVDTTDLPEYEMILDQELWDKLAYEEQQAPAIAIAQGKPQHELIQKVVYPPRGKRKISKFVVFTLLNAAAVVLLFLILRFFPPQGGIEVATLADSLNAKWVDARGATQTGTRLPINKTPILLSEGLAELHFDNNAKVVVEGPAEFLILAADRIGLNYGKVYATVPKEAVGFSIYAKHAKIIDLGTEFGVAVDAFGDTRLHVIEGKTALLVGDNSTLGSMEIGRGVAKKVLAATSTTVDIPYDSGLFVRAFDSENRLVWKGQKAINLADIVGGGTGFGTGTIDMGIDPISGKPSSERPGTRESTNDYRPVPSSPYIDGVIVPNGQTPQVVSSQGHLFGECPVTNGSCSQNIRAFTNFDCFVLENISDNKAQTPFLYLHANMGITFDLEAIRRSLPGVKIARFQSQCGIRKYAGRPSASNADFWVLVDGKVRFKQQQVKTGGLYPIDIELSENDRFLTLAETDGGDPEGRILEGEVLSANDSDWGVFVDPVLILESR
jgi:hypothetical protein